MVTKHRVLQRSAHAERGVALILTLLIVAMLTVLVVGFNAATRTEQMAARNFSKQSAASVFAATAEQEASALLGGLLANAADTRLVTQPGRALVFGQNGTPQYELLSSANDAPAGTGSIDLNDSRAISTNANTNYFRVPFVNVYTNDTDGSKPVGRYAFWIDDNGSRLNLNYAGITPRASFYPTNARSFNLASASPSIQGSVLQDFGKAVDLSSYSPNNPTWGYFFSPRQISAFTNSSPKTNLWRPFRFQFSGGPGNMTNRQPVPGLGGSNQLNGPFLAQPPVSVGAAELQRNFLEQVDNESALLTEIDNFIERRLDTAELKSRFGGRGFVDKYTEDFLRQIVVNINDLPLATGTETQPGMTAVTGVVATNSDGIPLRYAGQRPFPFLNEIVVRAAKTTNGVAPGSAMEVQLWIGIEMINPYNQAWGEAAGISLGTNWGEIELQVAYEAGGAPLTKTISTNWNGYALILPVTESIPANTISTGVAGQDFSIGLDWQIYYSDLNAGASNVTLQQVTYRPYLVSLRQWTNAPGTVRDWAYGQDFPQFTFPGPAVPQATTVINPTGAGGSGPLPPPQPMQTFFSGPAAQGIAKNDPRVRRFADVAPPQQPWGWLPVGGNSPNAVTMGANNSVVNFSSGTGLGLPNDDPPNVANVVDHPAFDVELRTVNSGYLSAFELGKVHTGLPWRTLQMHSQPTIEANNRQIPDWALLEVFGATNANVPVVARANPSALPYPAMDAGLTTATVAAQGLARPSVYAGLLNGFAASPQNPDQATLLLNGAPTNAGLSALARFATTNAAALAASNIAVMKFSDAWSSRRSSLSGFPPNVFGSLSEIVEVDGVGNVGTSKQQKEQRARVVYESMAPYSHSFTIYSVGQALEINTVAGETITNVLGEVRNKTQVEFNPATGRVQPVYTEPILPAD